MHASAADCARGATIPGGPLQRLSASRLARASAPLPEFLELSHRDQFKGRLTATRALGEPRLRDDAVVAFVVNDRSCAAKVPGMKHLIE